jgi:purine nucleosidase
MARPGLTGSPCPTRPCRSRAEHAVDFIIETLRREAPGSVTLCPLGPLDQYRHSLPEGPRHRRPRRRDRVMGGAYFEVGNITPAAEFNIYVDPEAAAVVFASGAPIVVMPLDVTHKALTSREWVEGMRLIGTDIGRAVASWTDFFERFDVAKYGSQGAPLHDPCVIAYLVKPSLFEGKHINVEIETEGRLTAGMTSLTGGG